MTIENKVQQAQTEKTNGKLNEIASAKQYSFSKLALEDHLAYAQHIALEGVIGGVVYTALSSPAWGVSALSWCCFKGTNDYLEKTIAGVTGIFTGLGAIGLAAIFEDKIGIFSDAKCQLKNWKNGVPYKENGW